MSEARRFRILRLARIALNVTDLERSARFYREALGFIESGATQGPGPDHPILLSGPFRSLNMSLGKQAVELTQWEPPGRPYPRASRANDLWFQHFAIVTCDIKEAYSRLARFGASPITTGGPRTLPATSGGVIAYKFRDPDGHPLELLQFPDQPAASGSGPALNTGIDHTAISVGQSDESIAFYHQFLGLSLISTQENTGPAQDDLDGLPNTRVQVTALAAAHKTPHLELLGYQTPRGRRPTPILVSDMAASRIVFQVETLPDLLTALVSHRARSPATSPFRVSDRAALVCDPDGHLLFFEPTS